MKKVLFITESIWYEKVILDVLKEGGISVDAYESPDWALQNVDKLNEYDYIVVNMFLAVGYILDINRCCQGTKTGIVLLSEIKDKIKKPKLILKILSSFEIDNEEYEWCKKNNIKVFNECWADYDSLYKLIKNNG